MKVLIVRFSAIGDCAMAAWAVSGVRRAGHEVGWAIEDRCAAVVSPRLAQLFAFPRKHPAGIGEGWRKQRGHLLPFLRVVKAIRRRRYDVGVDLQGHAKTALLLRLSGVGDRRIVPSRDPLARRLGRPLHVTSEHEVERAAEALRFLGVRQDALRRLPIMPVNSPPLVNREALIAVSAGSPEKALPPTTVTAVATALTRAGCSVALIGGPTDVAPADLGGATDLVGRLSLAETVARIGGTNLVIAGDTGAGHIAAAYGVRSISVFGPTEPDRYRPWGEEATVLRRGLTPDAVSAEEIVAAALQGIACAS